MGKLITTSVTKIINVNSEVVEWNYWDHEHLGFIHSGYNNTSILMSNNTSTIFLTKLKIPFFLFKINALNFQHRPKKNRILVYTTLYGALQKTDIRIIPKGLKKTKIIMKYYFDLPLYLSPFSKIIIALVKKWNHKVWIEDLPLKIRRQEAINSGFIDYKGINKLQNKSNLNYECKLPVPKPKDTYLDNHKFKY